MGWRAQPVRTRRAGVDHTNQPTMSACSPGDSSSYRFVPDFSVHARARRRNEKPSSGGESWPPHRSWARGVPLRVPDAGRPETGSDQGKARPVPAVPLFRGNSMRVRVRVRVRVRACAHARVEVRRNRYNRYKLPLYPSTSLRNQGSRVHGGYRFSKITAQNWYTTHTCTSPQKPV